MIFYKEYIFLLIFFLVKFGEILLETFINFINSDIQFVIKFFSELYRGCFDGWQSTRVLSDYVGCRTQIQNGRMSEWCFCDEHLCNEGSMQAMKQLDPYVMPYHVTKRPTVHRHPVVHHYYGERERTNIPSTRRPSKLLQSGEQGK